MPERAIVDRIEGGNAVLLIGAEGQERVTVPARMLPPGTHEGAAVDLSLAAAPEDTTREEVQGLMDELFSESEGAR